MNLIIDQGNTRTKIYVFDGQQNIVYENAVQDREKVLPELRRITGQYAVSHSIYSVVGERIDAVVEFLDQTTEFIFFDSSVPVPIKNTYETPQTLGADRLAAAVGANYLFPAQNVLICDIGTAITLDVVSGNAEFLGGNISPGPLMRFRAMHEFTARLPLVGLDETNTRIGKNTRQAILNGVVWGIVHEIEGYIDFLSLGFKNLRTIFTGGFAYYFGKKMKSTIFVELKIVPIGLNRVIEFNK